MSMGNTPESDQAIVSDIVNALLEVAIDPTKMASVPAFPSMCREYLEGRWSRERLKQNFRKINAANGGRLSLILSEPN